MDPIHKLKELGIDVICSQQDTLIQVQIQGLAGKKLLDALRLADQVIVQKVQQLIEIAKKNSNSSFIDPVFGPGDEDIGGAKAICKDGLHIPSKGGSRHQVKMLKLIKDEKIRWERPLYRSEDSVIENNQAQEDEEEDGDEYGEDEYGESSASVFTTQGVLFDEGASSGDVIQGNLGDCWYLGAISVLATRMDLLRQVFWRLDQYKQYGMFICRFMKDFVWNYVIIDDRIPVFGFNGDRPGKPYFARCRNPDELWVPMIEKAYAKLHGSYESLIGGYIDVALNDLTGLCSEQIIMKEGHPGFAEDPFHPNKPQEKRGDAFWEKLLFYRDSGTLMGCSIQPPPKGTKVAVEASAGQGLNYKHAYGLIDVGEIDTVKGEKVRLVKIRNPWGMGEWSGAWSDESDERIENEEQINKVFKVMHRKLGSNASKLIVEELDPIEKDTEPQHEVTELNRNDGTFFMTFDDWMNRFTHFFAGLDFPDEWVGTRIEGKWDEQTCGGNTTKKTWENNPRFMLSVHERCKLFISLSQDDPRGKDDDCLIPLGFHICSVVEDPPNSGKLVMKEPPNKPAAYYRLYNQHQTNSESLPPAIIPGTVIEGIDEDGVPQPAYTFKQAVSTRITIEPGNYFIVPSLYMRKNRKTGATNVGKFWISVYGDKPQFQLEGGKIIAEEEEGNEVPTTKHERVIASKPAEPVALPPVEKLPAQTMQLNCKFEDIKDELMEQASKKGIGYREVKREFEGTGKSGQALSKMEFKRKLMRLGFKLDELTDDKLSALVLGVDKDKNGKISTEEVLKFFLDEMDDDQVLAQKPPIEDDEVPEKINQAGILKVELTAAKDLRSSSSAANSTSVSLRIPKIQYSKLEMQDLCDRSDELLETQSDLAGKLVFLTLLKLEEPQAIRKKIKEMQSKPLQPEGAVKEYYKKLFESKKPDIHDDDDDFIPTLPQRSSTVVTVAAPTNVDDPGIRDARALHSSERMKKLEQRRSEGFRLLKKQKNAACGDKEKLAKLPRLVGGLKRSSGGATCEYCSNFVDGKNKMHTCEGKGCVQVFCNTCWTRLYDNRKYCEDCFQHESISLDVFGVQLRSMLVKKLGSSQEQLQRLKEQFDSFDTDRSGQLNRTEFAQALHGMNLHPPLSDLQMNELLDQFDTNGDGLINFEEFKKWLLEDQVWAPNQQPDAHTVTSDNVAAALIDYLIDRIHQAAVLRSHSSHTASYNVLSSSSGFSKTPLPENDKLIFQRLLPISSLESENIDAIESTGIKAIFDKFDINGDSKIQFHEMKSLLYELGYNAHDNDVQMLMDRFDTDNDGCVSLQEFSKFILSDGSVAQRSLHTLTSKLAIKVKEQKGKTDENTIEKLFIELTGDAPKRELVSFCDHILDEFGIQISVLEAQRLAIAFDFQNEPKEKVSDEEKTMYHSAGKSLFSYLLLIGENPQKSVHSADISIIRKAIVELTQGGKQKDQTIESRGIDPEKSWHVFTGSNKTVSQNKFIQSVLDALPDSSSGSIDLHLLGVNIAMVLDQCRCKYGIAHQNEVTYSLYSTMVCKEQFDELEAKLRETLRSLRDSMNGQQRFQISIGIERPDIIHVIASDPVFLNDLHLVFRDETITTENVCFPVDFQAQQQLLQPWLDTQAGIKAGAEEKAFFQEFDPWKASNQSRTEAKASFYQAPYGIINPSCHPIYDKAINSFCKRLRLVHDADSTLRLSLVESDALVEKIRKVLTNATNLPFFFSVSTTALVFSVDRITLKPGMSAKTFVMSYLSHHPKLKSFFSSIQTLLHVTYEITGERSLTHEAWNEFSAHLDGLRHAYAHVKFLPQECSFATPVDYTGGSNPSWKFEYNINVTPSMECVKRTDRPVVFMDVHQIDGVPDNSGQNRVSFVSSASKSAKSAKLKNFVVLSVRKTLPSSAAETSRLYCTAYDPQTASDFEVHGTPDNWSVDFFEEGKERNIEAEWTSLISKMYLGATITPKLVVKVYNKLKACDTFIGACEISVAAVLAAEGFALDNWFPIYNLEGYCCGHIKLRAQFEMSTKRNEIQPLPPAPVTPLDPKVLQPTIARIPSKELKSKEPPPSTLNDDTISLLKGELEKSHQTNNQLERRIHRLQQQLEQTVTAPSEPTVSDSGGWKRKYERIKRQQEELTITHDKKIKELQEKVAALTHVPTPTRSVTPKSFTDANLPEHASIRQILDVIHQLLSERNPTRPYNAIKKALVAVADTPDRVGVQAFYDTLVDFGFSLSTSQYQLLTQHFDPSTEGFLSIEQFFKVLAGDVITITSPKTSPPPSTAPQKLTIDYLRNALPPQWEVKVTEAGRPYYCNHATRTTQWKHPIPEVAEMYTKMANAEKLQRRLSRGSSNSPRNRKI